VQRRKDAGSDGPRAGSIQNGMAEVEDEREEQSPRVSPHRGSHESFHRGRADVRRCGLLIVAVALMGLTNPATMKDLTFLRAMAA
jgi:hypothetical protein